MTRTSANELSDRVLQWIITSVDPRAEVVSIRKLDGSTSSTLHSVSLQVNAERKDFVLRQFDNVKWLRDEPDLARHEAESLRTASRSTIKAPGIIAFDEPGNECGIPAVLMTHLDGAVVLRPENLDEWLHGLAEALVRIHEVDADDFARSYYTYTDIASLKTPTWSTVPAIWEAAIEVVKGPRPAAPSRFIHRDYHPANVLWAEDKVSGVVDWVNACRGPAGIDLGHCRLNLAELFGVATADAFLEHYRREAGTAFSYHPFWDLVSVIDVLSGPPTVYPGWAAFGVTDLTDKLVADRLDAYVESLVKRL